MLELFNNAFKTQFERSKNLLYLVHLLGPPGTMASVCLVGLPDVDFPWRTRCVFQGATAWRHSLTPSVVPSVVPSVDPSADPSADPSVAPSVASKTAMSSRTSAMWMRRKLSGWDESKPAQNPSDILTCWQEGCDTQVCSLCYDDFEVCDGTWREEGLA